MVTERKYFILPFRCVIAPVGWKIPCFGWVIAPGRYVISSAGCVDAVKRCVNPSAGCVIALRGCNFPSAGCDFHRRDEIFTEWMQFVYYLAYKIANCQIQVISMDFPCRSLLQNPPVRGLKMHPAETSLPVMTSIFRESLSVPRVG